MSTYSITAPNGKTYRMQGPPGLTEDDVIEHVLKLDPEAGKMPPPPKTGMGAAFQSGLENMISSGKAGVQGMFGDTQAAAEEAAAAEKEQGKKYDPQLGLARLQDVYEKSGILGAGKELVGQGFRGIAQSAPEMATMAGGAKLGSMVGSRFGPVGGLVGGIGGGILGGILPNTGRNLAQQEEAAPGTAKIGPALAAGAGQSALEEVTPLLLMGGRVASKVLGVDAAALIKRLGPEAAEEVAKRSLMRTVGRGAAEGAAGEATTEVMQDMLSRLQAGQNLLDADALKTYADSALGGALPGTIMGGAGHAYNRSGAKAEVADTERAAAAAQEQEAAAAAQAQQEAAAAERARKMADQGYVQEVADNYAEYEKTKAAMHAEAAEFKAEGTDAGKLAFNDKLKEIAAFEKENKDLLKEFNTVARPAIKEAKLRAAAEEAERAKRYGPAVGTPMGKKETPEAQATMYGQEKGTSDARNAARVEELQALIEDHERGIDKMHAQARAAVGTRMGSAMAAADTELKARDKTYQAAKAELEGLLTPEQRKDRADVEALDAREKALQTFNPIGARKKIDALEKRLAEVEAKGDPSELKTAAGWANEIKRLQELLKEHTKRQEKPAPAEDLFGLGERLAGEQAAQQRAARKEDVVGRRAARQSEAFGRQLAAEDAGMFSDLPKLAGETGDLLTNRLFATREPSGLFDSLAGMEGEGDNAALPANVRERDVHTRLLKERAKRMQGVIEPRATAAMQEVADEGETIGEVPQPGRQVPPGTMPRRERLVDEEGQGMLFQPEAGPEVAPAVALRQRIAGILARPGLTGQARATLKHADEVLDKPGLPPRVLENITEMVSRAERGIGGGAPIGATVTPEGGLQRGTEPPTKVGSLSDLKALTGPPTERRLLGTLRAGPAVVAKEAPARMAPGSEAYVSDVAAGTRRPKGSIGPKPETHARHVYPGEAEARKGRVELRDRRTEGEIEDEDHKGEREVAPLPAAKRVKPQRLELEPAPDTGPDINLKQGELFDPLFVGRESGGRFQRALDTGAIGPEPTVGKTAAERVKQVQAEGRVLAWNVKGLKDRLSDSLKAARRLTQLGERLKDRESDRKSMATLLQNRMLHATVAAEDSAAAARKLVKQANEAEAANEGGGAELRQRASQAGRTARRHADRVEEYKREIRTLTDLDAAPALAETADRGARIRKELTEAEAALQAHGPKLLQARLDAGKEATAAREKKAAAIEKSKSGEVGTMGEAKFPTVAGAREQAAKSAKARRMAAREERDALVAKQKQLAVSSPNVQGVRILPQSRPAGVTMTVEMQNEGVQDAIKEATRVPGITKTELQEIVDRVGTLTKKNAFPSRQGELDTEINEVLAEMRALRELHPKGVLPKRYVREYAARKAAIERRMAAIKDTESAEERAKRIKWLAESEAHIKFMDGERVPLTMHEPRNKKLAEKEMATATAPEMHALRRRHALATFESKVLDMQQSIAEAANYQPTGAEKRYVAPKREYAQGEVQPQTEIGNKPWSRTQLRADREAKSAFGYKGRSFEGIESAQERIAAEQAAREAHAQTGESVREVKTSENQGGKTVHKIIRENRPETEPGKEQLRPEARVPEGVQQAEAAVAKRRVAAVTPDAEAAARQSEQQYIAAKARYELLKTAVQSEAVTPTQDEFRAKQEAIVADKDATDDARRDAKVLLRALNELQADPKAEAQVAMEAQAERQRLYKKLNQAAKRKKKAAQADEAGAVDRKGNEIAEIDEIDNDLAGLTTEDEDGRFAKELALLDEQPLSAQAAEFVRDGQLDKALDLLAKEANSPMLRALAAKLQTLTKDAKVVVDPNVKSKGKPVAGQYASKTNTVHIHPNALTEETLLHEVGHAATVRLLSVPENQLTKEQRNARNEIDRLLHMLQKDKTFGDEYGITNRLELAAEVLMNKDLRAKIDARKPGFIERFINAVKQLFGVRTLRTSAEAQAAVEKFFAPSRVFTADETAFAMHSMHATEAPSLFRAAPAAAAGPQSAMDRFGSQINAAPHKQGIMSTVKDANAGLYAEMLAVDQRAPIIKALSMGAKHAFMQAQYYIRKSDARMAQVHAVLMNGGPKLKKDAKGFFTVESGHGPSAKDVFAKVDKLPGATTAEKFAKAQSYMVAQRAANVGWDKLGWVTTDQTRKLGEAMLAEVNANPQLKAQLDAVRTSYNEYNKGLVSFLADTGAIPQAEATRLLQHGDYVPFYRVAANGLAELVLGESTHVRIGDIRKQPYLAQLKGDEGKLLPLNEAIMRNTMLLMDKGLSNLATKEIAYSLQAMGKEKGPVSPRTGERNDLNVIKRGNAPAGADVIKFNQEPDKEGDNGERWVRITSEGTPYEGIPAEMLVQSLEGTHTVMTGLGKLASKFGDTLRHGVTRSPAYVIRQLIRDPMAASFTGGAERGPVAAMLKSVKEFVDQSKGSTKTGEALLKKGVTQSQVFTGDADDIAMTVHQLAAGNQSAYRKFLNVLDRAAMRADAATRSQVYEDVLKKTGSEMQAELAAIEMMNFTKRGSHPAAQHAARTIPFLNAQIQSLNVLYKAATGKATMEEQMQIRAKFIKSAVNLSLFSMVYAIGMEDNDEYKNATANDRISNFFVPTPWGTFKIPIPYEIGLLFKAIPEVMIHGFDDAEMKALGKMAFNTIPGASSYGIPQMAKPALELAMNKNIYTGRDIETADQQKLAPELRYNEHTTELAKWAGAQLGASPLKMEHLARGYLGGLPIAAASLANALFTDKTTPSGRASQAPVLGGFVADPLAAGAVERAYEQANAIEQAGNTYDKLVKEGRVKDAKDYMEDNLNVLQADKLNEHFRAAMTRAKQERERVLASNLLPDKKQERLDYIAKWRNDQAALFTKAANSIVAVR